MINVGVIGLGMMGLTHLDVYAKRTDARVIAIADPIEDRRTGNIRAVGNIGGQASGGFDYASARQYDEGMKLIADPDVLVVDICLVTPMHLQYALAALDAGKHVLVEKPLARTAADALALAEAAERAPGFAMCAMCMRFWPAWVWLKEQMDAGTYGKTLSATFRRLATHPSNRGFYADGAACGGAVLDLHIHDTDFIRYCFGMPQSVSTLGYRSVTSELDHVVTQYRYRDGPMVVAEGGWSMAPGFSFQMEYTVNFERATARFIMGSAPELQLWEAGKSVQAIAVNEGMGYQHEIAYFLKCIETGIRPNRVTLRDAAGSVALVEAEVRSARSGKPCVLDSGSV